MATRTYEDLDGPRNVRECHWCGEPFGDFFAGQYGSDEVWVIRHTAPSASDHAAEDSETVWARYATDEDVAMRHGYGEATR